MVIPVPDPDPDFLFWWVRWKLQRRCFHHDDHAGTSWIKSSLIDLGRHKLFWCVGCGKRWVF